MPARGPRRTRIETREIASEQIGISAAGQAAPRLWVDRITLTNFRNYAAFTLEAGPEPVVLIGANGVGKTNLLEALSLLTPGQGLRRASFADLAAAEGDGGWTATAHVHSLVGAADIGTGLAAGELAGDGTRRIVRINGVPQSGSGALGDYVEMVWVTPSMDGLFTGPASERRRFLDRLILCFDRGYRTRIGQFERAMQQRNRLLADGVKDSARLGGFEVMMAETGVAIAAARLEIVAALSAVIEARRGREPGSPFPWATLAVEGTLETDLGMRPAVDVEDAYQKRLAETRERDRAVGRTLEGPHRSDLVTGHGAKAMPAKLCSTGEQKALLLGLVLAHAELVALRQAGVVPILLLDEVSAHLDEVRRAALFTEILRLGAQAWMTGTDAHAFNALHSRAQIWQLDSGRATPWQ